MIRPVTSEEFKCGFKECDGSCFLELAVPVSDLGEEYDFCFLVILGENLVHQAGVEDVEECVEDCIISNEFKYVI